MADASPTSLTIRELSGDGRTIRLAGRALPYRPLRLGGEQRLDSTWYPGNPIGTVQVFGAKESDTQMSGQWKDRFISSLDAFGAAVVPDGVATVDGAQVADVVALVKVVDDVRRKGQLLEVAWDAHVRHGVLQKFDHSWNTRHDVEWDANFLWISQGEPEGPPVLTDVDASDLATAISSGVSALTGLATPLFAASAVLTDAVKDDVADLQGAAAEVVRTASRAVDSVTAPIEAAQRTLGILAFVSASARALRDQVTSIPSALAVAAPDPAGVGLGRSLKAALFSRRLTRQAREVRSVAVEQGQRLSARVGNPDLASVFVAREALDLREVSTKFYGTPNEWRRLMAFNRVASSKLAAGQIVYVPKLRSAERQVI